MKNRLSYCETQLSTCLCKKWQFDAINCTFLSDRYRGSSFIPSQHLGKFVPETCELARRILTCRPRPPNLWVQRGRWSGVRIIVEIAIGPEICLTLWEWGVNPKVILESYNNFYFNWMLHLYQRIAFLREAFKGESRPLCQGVPFVHCCSPSCLIPLNKGHYLIWTEYLDCGI